MLDLDMSPYGAFVWPAWAITVIILGAVVIRAVLYSRRWKAELKRLEAEDAQPEAAPGTEGGKQ
jgi:heme exporter protein D